MTDTAPDPNDNFQSQAKKIVAEGDEIRRRLSELFAQTAASFQRSGQGLVDVVKTVIDGARQGLEQSAPAERDHALRQVIDAVEDGLSRTALAGQLVVQEAVNSSKQFANEDVTRLREDLTKVRALLTDTVARGLKASKDLTTEQIASALTHAGRATERLGPTFTLVVDAIRQHPVDFAKESLQASVGAGQGAAGALFQALGKILQQTGEELCKDKQSADQAPN